MDEKGTHTLSIYSTQKWNGLRILKLNMCQWEEIIVVRSDYISAGRTPNSLSDEGEYMCS